MLLYFLVSKIMYEVLARLSDSKLVLNHSEIIISSSFNCFSTLCNELLVRNKKDEGLTLL